MTSDAPTRFRTTRRALTVITALFGALLTPAVAMADVPEFWETAPEVSGWQFVTLLVIIPAAITLVLTVLTYLPSKISKRDYEAENAWRYEPEPNQPAHD